MTFDFLELDVTDEAYEALKIDDGRAFGPFLLVGLDGEAFGLLEMIPDLDIVEYAEGCTNQSKRWVEYYKDNYKNLILVNARQIQQSEFDTYRHLKALPAMEYAFHLPKPEIALITFGLIACTTS